MKDLNEEKITALFDELVSENIIIYGPHESIRYEAGRYPLEFRVCKHLNKKPHTVGAKLSSSFDKSRKWGPGSDMYCPDERLILGQLNDTHDLALNLFCVDRPQLLMLTLDSYQRQYDPLALDDFKAALELLRLFPGMYVIYNCSEAGGCSRMHKHMQGLKGPPYAFEYLIHASEEKLDVPFRYFTHHFDQTLRSASATEVLDVYRVLIDRTREVLQIGPEDVCPHNVVLWDDRLIVIPRRRGFLEGASANSGGMTGCVWVPDETQVDEWKRLGFTNVLRELGVPSA
ncbi:ATP adenylyltransferase [Ascochyta rabiei]|uniref:ATP adenylyltransferase n=1 Tax=Didymella rabiei TaxID=5454 RepID=A0A162WAM3_DIDRA|nr:ATP adenylyltransferase [Ascochyta rabiei]KZM18915.1 ATP adenylyltransferase [Ascochyta rabiei]UPX16266.1 ATP adenylyltransferase [Ascochyta rabiei]